MNAEERVAFEKRIKQEEADQAKIREEMLSHSKAYDNEIAAKLAVEPVVEVPIEAAVEEVSAEAGDESAPEPARQKKGK